MLCLYVHLADSAFACVGWQDKATAQLCSVDLVGAVCDDITVLLTRHTVQSQSLGM